MNNLQKALTINALFSSISGTLMILLNLQIAHLFGTTNNTVFWIVGIILIYFAITIWYEITKQRKFAVLWIIIQDFLLVIGSIILIVLDPFKITQTGSLIIIIIAIIVLGIGLNQYKSLVNSTKNK